MVNNRESEEIVDMGESSDGVYKPVAIIRRPTQVRKRVPVFWQFIDGVEVSINVLERFIYTLEKLNRVRR